jgi:hypothetical protein
MMPLRFYPDTNTVHELWSAFTPTEFDLMARNKGFILCLGHQNYELARSFLYDHPQETVTRAFEFLSEIECVEYLPNVNQSIKAEAHLAKTGMPLITVVGPLNQAAVKQELTRLAKGYSDDARKFISKREQNAAIEKIRVTKQNQSSAAKARSQNGQKMRQIKTFESLQKELKPGRPGWVANFLRKKGHLVTQSAINRILNNPTKFPLLNTIVNTQEYLYFITAFHGTEPGKDTLDDFRHLVESSLADIFVTMDGDLLKQALKTRPFKPFRSWQEFKSDLGLV